MKRIVLVSMIVLLAMPSCKFIKTKILSRKVDTLSVYTDTLASTAPIDTPYTQEMADDSQYEPVSTVPAKPEKQVSMPVAAPADMQFYMIVGCFTVPENASRYAEKIRGMGYEGDIIQGRDGFQMVTARSYGNFRTSVSEIDQFRSDITPNAWVFVRR